MEKENLGWICAFDVLHREKDGYFLTRAILKTDGDMLHIETFAVDKNGKIIERRNLFSFSLQHLEDVFNKTKTKTSNCISKETQNEKK